MITIDLFQQQIDSQSPTTGDFLNGRAREDVVASMIAAGKTAEEADAWVTSKIAEWQAHSGEHLLVFSVHPVAASVDEALRPRKVLRRVWESQVADLNQQYEPCALHEAAESSVPHFKVKPVV
jgi:predicted acylesterase/phospholipase RssA